MTKARRDGCNCRTMGVLSFVNFTIACDACVTCFCIKPILLCIYIDERLKHIDGKLLFLLIYDRCLRCDFRCIVVRCCTLIYQVHIMGYVPYVGFATHRRATVRIHLHFKRLMFKQMICIKKKKKKKGCHNLSSRVPFHAPTRLHRT
jgi:hypothetical protein